MRLYLVTAECGDYYCEGEHVVAVATTMQDADRLAEEARAYKHTAPGGRSWTAWLGVEVVEIEADALAP